MLIYCKETHRLAEVPCSNSRGRFLSQGLPCRPLPERWGALCRGKLCSEFAVIDGVNLPSLQQTLKFRLEISVQFWRFCNFESTHLMVGTVSYLCSSTHVAGDEWVWYVLIGIMQQGVVCSVRLVCGQRQTTDSQLEPQVRALCVVTEVFTPGLAC